MRGPGRRTARCLLGGVILACACTTRADKPPSRSAAIEPTVFVQRFYDWYAPIARESSAGGPAWNIVLNDSSALLGSTLLAALRADSASQAAAVGEIAGIDFDPFLSAQDPCEKYKAGPDSASGDSVVVKVQALCGTQTYHATEVILRLAPNGVTWVIGNIRYPEVGSDLLTQLHSLQVPATPTDSGVQ